MHKLYRFYNRNASSVRSIMVANCPWLNNSNSLSDQELEIRPKRKDPLDLSNLEGAGFSSDEYCAGNPISQAVLEQLPSPVAVDASG